MQFWKRTSLLSHTYIVKPAFCNGFGFREV